MPLSCGPVEHSPARTIAWSLVQLDSAGGEACTSGDRPDVFLFRQSGASLRGFLGLFPGVVLSGQMEAHMTQKSALMLQWTRQDAPGRVLGVT